MTRNQLSRDAILSLLHGVEGARMIQLTHWTPKRWRESLADLRDDIEAQNERTCHEHGPVGPEPNKDTGSEFLRCL